VLLGTWLYSLIGDCERMVVWVMVVVGWKCKWLGIGSGLEYGCVGMVICRWIDYIFFFWGFGDFWVGYVGKKAWDCEFLYRYLIFRFGNNFISYPRKDLCVAL